VRIITLNANGIRAAARKGFFAWLPAQHADVVCLQETRAWQQQLGAEPYYPAGLHCYYRDAERKGYSGVAIYARKPPAAVIDSQGLPELDTEGRYLEVRFDQLSVVSLYLPSGSSGPQRQAVKFAVLERLLPYFEALRNDGREYVFCGDWNIAHQPIDLKNWQANQKNSGFLPEERAWLDELFGRLGYVDAFRVVNPAPEQYTWWSNRGQAWAKNVGWRLDYQVITPGLAPTVQAAAIYKDQRFSDHAPLIMDYDYVF